MATRMDHDKADELLEQDLCRHTADLKPRTQPWAKQVLNTSANASFWTPVATACLPQGGNEVSSDRWAHQRSPLPLRRAPWRLSRSSQTSGLESMACVMR